MNLVFTISASCVAFMLPFTNSNEPVYASHKSCINSSSVQQGASQIHPPNIIFSVYNVHHEGPNVDFNPYHQGKSVYSK
jgi:hypothetical protein